MAGISTENYTGKYIEERMGKIIGKTLESTVTNIPQVAAEKICEYLSEVSKGQEEDLYNHLASAKENRIHHPHIVSAEIITKYYLIPKPTTK